MDKIYLINFWAAWIGIIGGFVSGAVMGLSFHKDNWLGGYGTWRRRMIRLGHISFFGIGFINLLYALSSHHVQYENLLATVFLIIGAVAMPLICFLSGWKKVFRHLFFIPVISLVAGGILFLYQGGLL
ncbi:MAG: hypothetical protein ABFS19_05465 [Thermodesulfobacteriota bacterium]